VAPVANALIGVPTGRANGFVVLDLDVKNAVNGLDTLADLGFAILPDTPMVHTASGGLHLYFEPPASPEIRNTGGARGRGIGPGLDWRGEGGFVIVPSSGNGYCWDPQWNPETAALAPVPTALLPRKPERRSTARPVRPVIGLSPYAEAALDSACRHIMSAQAGEQEVTMHRECFSIGTLAGAGAIPTNLTRRTLIWAAHQMPDHDPRRPWRAHEIEAKVNRAFDEGMRHPREARRA
jgi:Bifunctional DNA primase/polymerase, N-terminal